MKIHFVFLESEPSELMKKPWFIGVMIGTICGMLWLILCIFTIFLCKRRKNKKKMKDQRYYTGGRWSFFIDEILVMIYQKNSLVIYCYFHISYYPI